MATATGGTQGEGLNRLIVGTFGAVAAFAGGIILAAWALGLRFVMSLGPEMIPMAPSTAVLFVGFGAALALVAFSPRGRGVYWFGLMVHTAGALVALLLLVLSYRGVYLPVEHLGFTAEGAVGGVPIGHMSPLTALCFLIASLSFLAALPSARSRRTGVITAWWLACLLLLLSSILLLAYLYGAPLLYGGDFIPPAATTGIAFAALGTALAALAGPRAWPAGPLRAGVSNRPAAVLVLVFTFLAAGIISAGYLYLRGSQAHYRAEVERSLESIADLKVEDLADYRRERLGDALVFHRNAAFTGLVDRVLDDPADDEARAHIVAWLGRAQSHYSYDRISLLDARGVERIAVPESAVPIASGVTERIPEVLRWGEIAMIDFHRSEHDRRVYMAMLVPVIGAAGDDRARGVVLFRIDPEVAIFPSMRRWPTSSETAETFLVRREGDDVLYLTPLRFHPNAPLELRFPLGSVDIPAVQAANGREGIAEGVDYRGVPVIAAMRAIPDSPWFLLARIDESEVEGPLRRQMWMTILLVGGLLLAAGAGAGSIWRRERARFYRMQYEAERDRAWLREVIARGANELWVFDPETLRFSFVNRGAITNIGYGEEELLRMTPLDVKPELTEESFRTLVRPLMTGEREVITFETIHRRKDGTDYPVEVQLQHIATADHAVFLALATDVTERRALEEQLRQAQKMEAVGRLAGGIAHDFNNQIFVISGYCDLLLSEAAGQPALLEEIEEIKKAAGRSAALTAQLLAFSRKQILQPKVLDLGVELREIEPMLRRLIGEHVRLTFALGAGVGSVRVDPGQLQQVIVNLALNARDAMPEGGRLTIETSDVSLDEEYAAGRAEVQPGRYVLLSVSDSGQGMDADTLARLFEPFFTTKELGHGTGLGLATVHGIVKQSGGHVEVYSDVSHGTTFKLYLPRVDESPEVPAAERSASAAGGTETILLVEDDAAVRELVGRVLSDRGYRVLTATGGAEALRLAEQSGARIDLLLTDVVMPEMSGPALAEHLQARYPRIRVLYMSGYTENTVVHQGVLQGRFAFLPKPCPTDVVLRRVRETLDAREGASLDGSRVLLVDDSENERILLARVLAKAGCIVLSAPGGSEALALLEREEVDAVITDVSMPGMSGFDLAAVIRGTRRGGDLPIVFLSGAFSPDDEEQARRVGAAACVGKGSADRVTLLDALARAL